MSVLFEAEGVTRSLCRGSAEPSVQVGTLTVTASALLWTPSSVTGTGTEATPWHYVVLYALSDPAPECNQPHIFCLLDAPEPATRQAAGDTDEPAADGEADDEDEEDDGTPEVRFSFPPSSADPQLQLQAAFAAFTAAARAAGPGPGEEQQDYEEGGEWMCGGSDDEGDCNDEAADEEDAEDGSGVQASKGGRHGKDDDEDKEVWLGQQPGV